MRSNMAKDETMFEESRSFMERKQDDIAQLSKEIENLQHKNFTINIKA